MQFQVVYQKQPYCNHSPSSMVVEAEDRASAFIVAADALIKRGDVVSLGMVDLDMDDAERKVIYNSIPEAKTAPYTAIRSIALYSPNIKGRVLEG